MSEDRDTDRSTERLSVGEAARRLGVSRDAVYKRVRRGSIPSETGEDGLLYVYVEPSIEESTEPSSGSAHLERLLTAQEREIEYLREQLAAERESRRRADHIIAALTERIPELEAPPATPQEAESVSGSPGGVEDREPPSWPETETSQGSGEPRRPWWRRLFGRW